MPDRLALDPTPAAVTDFERQLAETVGARCAVAVGSPATGLELACRTLGLGAGDVLWAAPNGRSAAAEVARACGATIDFVDVDPVTGALSTRVLTEKLHHAERHGRLPKVLVAYHEAGQPCDLAGLNHLGNLNGFHLIEEATEALGARYGETWVGDCRYGDMVVFGAGGGGVVTTNRDDWAQTLRQLGASSGMSEAQAARAAQELEALESALTRREVLAARYEAALPEIVRPWRNPDHRSALPCYPVRLMAEVGKSAPAPLHLDQSGFGQGDFPEAERYARETRYLPLDADMTEATQDEVIARVRSELG